MSKRIDAADTFRDSVSLFSVFFSLVFSLFARGIAVAETDLKVTFFDAGEGDATLVQSPSGEAVLIDTGNVVTAVSTVRKIQSRGVSELSALLITHPHPDHMGGLFALRELLSFKALYDNGEPLESAARSEDLYRWYSEVRTAEAAKQLTSGEVLPFGEATLRVLSPLSAGWSRDWNSNSLVLLLEFKNFRCLLMGDGNLATESELLKSRTPLKANVLKLGHHGAADATSRAFLDAVKPRHAIVSVNSGNIRGYPSPEVLERVRASGTEVLRTDERGDISVRVMQDGTVSVTSER